MTSRVALVTGASRGIGGAVARRLGASGFTIAVHFNERLDSALEVVDGIERAGGMAFAVQADLSDVSQIEHLFARIDDELELRGVDRGLNLDVVVNNAYAGGEPELALLDADVFDRIIAVNARAPLFIVQHAVLRMREFGRIINISSEASKVPIGRLAYSMSKGALNTMTVVLAATFGDRGITVNTVAPGWTETDSTSDAGALTRDRRSSFIAQTPLGRVGEVSDVAEVVAFLASSESRWVTGQYIEVNGGRTATAC